MHARLLNVLHNAANQHHFAVADSVNVHLYRVVKEAVQQYRRVVRDADRRHKVATQVSLVIDNLHRPAAQHVGGAHHQRVANLFRLLNRLLDSGHGGVGRLLQLQTVYRLLEALAVFGAVDSVRAGTDNRS